MDAWGDTGEKKSFGIKGMLGFTLPRLWRGTCINKFMVIFNVIFIFVCKGVSVLVPLVLREVVNAIICEENSDNEDIKEVSGYLLHQGDAAKCPDEFHTYMIVILYAVCKFSYDALNYIREVPYANMGAVAEISIAHDVYDHI